MDWERSPSRQNTSSDWENNRKITPQNKIKDIKARKPIPLLDPHLGDRHNNHQITSFQENFWFWLKQSREFYFSRGLLWGIVVGLTVILSASCGVALSKIDAVEKIVNSTIDRNSVKKQPVSQYDLTHPVNILLLEVEPNNDATIEFSQTSLGKSKTLLLLQLDPDLDIVRLINIPLDSRVNIPKFGWGTIEDANRYGGTSLVLQTVDRLLNNVTINRYATATPAIVQKLMASGKITFNQCNSRISDCSDNSLEIPRQRATLENIRQRLNVPSYFKNFKTTLKETRSALDTNLSVAEAMSIANFVREIEPDNIQVELVPGYIAGKNLASNDKLRKSRFAPVNPRLPKSKVDKIDRSTNKYNSFKTHSVAVQNTTNSPELGMRFVSYLRQQNFRDVYLVEHIPLKLEKTRIVLHQSQLARARHIKSTIGFGKLESKSDSRQKPLTIQIGQDARYLPLEKSFN